MRFPQRPTSFLASFVVVALAIAGVFLLVQIAPAAAESSESMLPLDAKSKMVGVGRCSSGQCHGSVCSGGPSRILSCELRIWQDNDPHSQAYNLLSTKRDREKGEISQRIVQRTGLARPGQEATQVAECLACHGANPPVSRRKGDCCDLKATDGVSCEACHGGAENWLQSHAQIGTTHAQNLQNGMYPTDDVVHRAELCLSCHMGDGKQVETSAGRAVRFITHAMMAAGHPRTSFELATYTVTQPAHFRIDDDYGPRGRGKQITSMAKTWAIGQAVAARQYLELIANPDLNRAGAWPEFTLYECDSCHQTIVPPKPSTASEAQIGFPRLADDSLTLAGIALTAARADSAGPLQELSRKIGDVSARDGLRAATSLAEKGQGLVTSGLANLAAWNPSDSELSLLLAAIKAEGEKGGLTYARAQQRYDAAQSILATIDGADPLEGEHDLTRTAKLGRKLGPIFATVRTEATFRREPGAFAVKIGQLQ